MRSRGAHVVRKRPGSEMMQEQRIRAVPPVLPHYRLRQSK